MKHEPAEFTFATARGCPPEIIDPIPSSFREHNALPNQVVCKVRVRAGKSNLEAGIVRRFREEYFASTSADLIAYDHETDNFASAYMMPPH